MLYLISFIFLLIALNVFLSKVLMLLFLGLSLLGLAFNLLYYIEHLDKYIPLCEALWNFKTNMTCFWITDSMDYSVIV